MIAQHGVVKTMSNSYGNTYVSLVFADGYTEEQKTVVKDNIVPSYK